MTKYIDAEKLRLSMADAFCMFDIPFHDITAKIVFNVIDHAPAVKLVGNSDRLQDEVKHGYWKVKETCGAAELLTCSVCEDDMAHKIGGNKSRYCPNCGAKMDGLVGDWRINRPMKLVNRKD